MITQFSQISCETTLTSPRDAKNIPQLILFAISTLRQRNKRHDLAQSLWNPAPLILSLCSLFSYRYGLKSREVEFCPQEERHLFSLSNPVHKKIIVAARSKAWTVFACWNAEMVSSNPTQGMDICQRLFCVCVLLCVGRGLATGWSLVQGVLSTVYRIKKLNKQPRTNKRTVQTQIERL
jgi:hypothetical protein